MSIGTAEIPEGSIEIEAYLGITKDEREVKVFKLADGSFAFETKSWLKINDRNEITHKMRFSEDTLVMLITAMFLGSSYFGIDLMSRVKAMAEGRESFNFETAGNGKFDQSKIEAYVTNP